MSKDKEIEELFKSFKPNVDAEGIMTKISDKLDVIDTVRPEHDRMTRFHRTISVCCFVVGLLTGCFLMSLALLHTFADNAMMDLAFIGRNFPELTLLFSVHGNLILTFLAAASFILGSLPLIYANEGA